MTAGREVRALRGATTVARDSSDAIVDATAELLRELLARNELVPDDLISLVFTATPDLTAEFPAVAARGLGISDVALLSAQEIAVPGSLPRCIRVLAHCYSTRPRADLRHVYLGDARELRTDLLEGEG